MNDINKSANAQATQSWIRLKLQYAMNLAGAMSDELQRSNMPFLIGIVNFETWWQIIDDLDNI